MYDCSNLLVEIEEKYFIDEKQCLQFEKLYDCFEDKKQRRIFATFHEKLINLLKLMNSRLPTNEKEEHYWAEPSRGLLDLVEDIFRMNATFEKSKFEFRIDSYYKELFEEFQKWLSPSGGSTIPPHHLKIYLYFNQPIFLSVDSLELSSSQVGKNISLHLVGEGSYAKVFKYKDDFYNTFFALKRANKDLDEKELKRFRQEFEIMKSVSSPYVVHVYRYWEDKHEYLMEFLDYSLESYLRKFNGSISRDERLRLVKQIFCVFDFLHSRKILHRDISPRNILLKKYDDSLVVKVSDFGLVKVPNSELTSVNSEMKGCFNDPQLRLEGFSNYSIQHETYALTYLVWFVMTGKVNIIEANKSEFKDFVRKGTHSDKNERFQNVKEMRKYFFEKYS